MYTLNIRSGLMLGPQSFFVLWLCKSETIEDHVVLYYAKVVSRCTRKAMGLYAAVLGVVGDII